MTASPQPKRFGIKAFLGVFLAVIIVSAVFLVALGNYSTASPKEAELPSSEAETKGLRFIEDVLYIDTSKYVLTVKSHNMSMPSLATPDQVALAQTK